VAGGDGFESSKISRQMPGQRAVTPDDPTPVRLVEIQTTDEEPLIGLITIRAEPVE